MIEGQWEARQLSPGFMQRAVGDLLQKLPPDERVECERALDKASRYNVNLNFSEESHSRSHSITADIYEAVVRDYAARLRVYEKTGKSPEVLAEEEAASKKKWDPVITVVIILLIVLVVRWFGKNNTVSAADSSSATFSGCDCGADCDVDDPSDALSGDQWGD